MKSKRSTHLTIVWLALALALSTLRTAAAAQQTPQKVSNADWLVQSLQKATSISADIVLRSGDGTTRRWKIQLTKPNQFRITTDEDVFEADGTNIVRKNLDGKVRDYKAQSPEVLRETLNTPELWIWTAFFDASSIPSASPRDLAPTSIQGEPAERIELTPKTKHFTQTVAIGNDSGLPVEIETQTASGKEGLKILVLNTKLGDTSSASTPEQTSVSKIALPSARTCSLDWLRVANSPQVHLLNASDELQVTFNINELTEHLSASNLGLELSLYIDGNKYSFVSTSHVKNASSFAIPLNKIGAAKHKLQIVADYKDKKFRACHTDVGTLMIYPVGQFVLPITRVIVGKDAVAKLKIADTSFATKIIAIKMKGLTYTGPLAGELETESDALFPGQQLVSGEITTDDNLVIPIKQASVNVEGAFGVTPRSADPVNITSAIYKDSLPLKSDFGLLDEVDGVSAVNQEFDLKNVDLSGDTIRIPFTDLLPGLNRLYVVYRLKHGRRIVSNELSLQVAMTPEVQRNNLALYAFQALQSMLSQSLAVASAIDDRLQFSSQPLDSILSRMGLHGDVELPAFPDSESIRALSNRQLSGNAGALAEFADPDVRRQFGSVLEASEGSEAGLFEFIVRMYNGLRRYPARTSLLVEFQSRTSSLYLAPGSLQSSYLASKSFNDAVEQWSLDKTVSLQPELALLEALEKSEVRPCQYKLAYSIADLLKSFPRYRNVHFTLPSLGDKDLDKAFSSAVGDLQEADKLSDGIPPLKAAIANLLFRLSLIRTGGTPSEREQADAERSKINADLASLEIKLQQLRVAIGGLENRAWSGIVSMLLNLGFDVTDMMGRVPHIPT